MNLAAGTDEFIRPKISIITPTFNAEPYIQRCIEKVQSQTFTSFEHIVVDGQSTDNTVNIVRDYQARYGNIHLKVEADKGVYDAMNKAIAYAKGEWLYFLGADDYFYADDVLAHVVAHINQSNALLFYGDVYGEGLGGIYDGLFPIEKILKYNICHQAMFYHRKVFQKTGIYNLRYIALADYEFNLRCWLGGVVKHQYIPLTVAFYAHGGWSFVTEDKNMVNDYPSRVIDIIASGNWNLSKKINLLILAYNEITRRYSAEVLHREIHRRPSVLLKLAAMYVLQFRTWNARRSAT